jgi:N-acetyl-anhydromuramyl-L-alanine amidase AmpD
MTSDEIIIAGERFRTGTRIVLWTDPGGFNGYETGGVQHFAERDRTRPGAWDLPMLRETIDQFVIHYDASGSSRRCFEVLQQRNLSVHFMLDTDGTIYQTLDVKERAWHATRANSRSVGIEIANVGAYPVNDSAELDQWYRENPLVHPARSDAVEGIVQGQRYRMYDLTPQQYEALIKLTATLCRELPRITCDYPRDSNGKLIDHVLTEQQFQAHHGLIGHYHVQSEKIDPGPAFQWDRVVQGARDRMRDEK